MEQCADKCSITVEKDKNVPKTDQLKLNLASLNQHKEEDDFVPARATFLSSVCHVCKKRPRKNNLTMCSDISDESAPLAGHQHFEEEASDTELRTCSGCRLIYYCSRDHQRLHWPLHRQLCRATATLLQRLQLPHLCQPIRRHGTCSNSGKDAEDGEGGDGEGGEWRELRAARLQVLQQQLGRQLQSYEREMVLYPRACAGCHETRQLSDCPRCHAVYSCCPEHWPSDHTKWCRHLLLFQQIAEHENRCGVSDPTVELRADYPALETGVITQLCSIGALALADRVAISEKASYPLTMLYALTKCWGSQRLRSTEQLNVHVVGAEANAECFDLFAWETLTLHMLPALKHVQLVFVGVQLTAQRSADRSGLSTPLDVDLTCDRCQRQGRRASCRLISNTAYHDYVAMSSALSPDIVCAFNAGLYRRHGWAGDIWSTSSDLWSPSLPKMLRQSVPLLITAYTWPECLSDFQRLKSVQSSLQQVIEPSTNPFASKRPVRNFVDEERAPLVYKNNFVLCVESENDLSKLER